jgi:hypothetical protein
MEVKKDQIASPSPGEVLSFGEATELSAICSVFSDLQPALLSLALAVPVLMGLCVALLKKQEI